MVTLPVAECKALELFAQILVASSPHTWGTTAEAIPTYSQNLGSFLRSFLWLAALEASAILTVMACSGPAAPPTLA